MTPRTFLLLGIAGLAAVSAVAAGVWKQLGVKSYGHPAGRVVRTDQHLSVLIETRDPYMPSLKGVSDSNMRYSYALWLIPETGDGDIRTIRLDRGVGSSSRNHNTGVQMFDSGVVWLQIKDLQGVDVASGQITRNSPPAALINAPISQLMGSNERPLEEYRARGVKLPGGEWLVLAHEDEIKADFKAGARLYDNPTASGTYMRRALNVVQVQPGVIPRVATVARLGEQELRNAAFMRETKGGPVVRFSSPDGFLVVHDGGDPVHPTIHFSRINADGTAKWTVDTTIGRLTQVLPHDSLPVLVGEPPQQLTEPLLAVVHLKDGTVKTRSLKGPLN